MEDKADQADSVPRRRPRFSRLLDSVPRLRRRKKKGDQTQTTLEIVAIEEGDRLATLLCRRWRRYVERKEKLEITRSQLSARLHLELHLVRGIRTLLLSFLLFIVLAFLALPRTAGFSDTPMDQYALQQSYTKLLGLEAMLDVGTTETLRDFMLTLSANSQSMLVLSDKFFSAQVGELRVISGTHEYQETHRLHLEAARPRVDGVAFTMTAWVQTRADSAGTFVLRKPLGTSDRTASLSCWGWFVGDRPRLDFGAHDYVERHGATEGEDSLVQLEQESIELEYEDGALSGGGRRWVHERGAAARLNFETIVVNQSSVSFFQNAEWVATRPLARPVTDCFGSALNVGSAGAKLGDVTVYARGLVLRELQELIEYGNTLANIATGKTVYVPEITPFDEVASAQKSLGARLEDMLLSVREEVAVEHTFTRADDDAPLAGAAEAPRLQVNATPGCVPPPGGWPTCNVMPPVNETLAADALLAGREYYQLSPVAPHALFESSGADWARAHHYEPAAFPSWRGTSATFSAWVRADESGYMITKSPDYDATPRCWTFHLEQNGLATIGGATVDGFIAPYNTLYLPSNAGFTFKDMAGLRHVAMVFDVASNSLRAYVDGASLGESFFDEPDTVAQLDCPSGNRTYVGIGHRAPGGAPFSGDIADVRMYVGQALGDAEIRQLAFAPGAPRSCSTDDEGADSALFLDIHGRDCAWYQYERLLRGVTNICSAPEVQRACPVACGLLYDCLTTSSAAEMPTYNLYDKIERVLPRLSGVGVLCPRAGLDLGAQCRDWNAAHAHRGASPVPTWPSPYWSWANFDVWARYMAIESRSVVPNVTDCELVEQITDPYCAFNPLPSDIDSTIRGQGFTISFWLQSLQVSTSFDSAGHFAPIITFYSSIAPAVPVAVVYVRKSGSVFAEIFGRCDGQEYENAAIISADFLPADAWSFIALTYDPLHGLMKLNVNGKGATDNINFWGAWCASPEGGFIEALSVSHSMLLSGIQVPSEHLLMAPDGHA